MFDRGLVSLSDELGVLVSRQVNDLRDVSKLVASARRAAAAASPAQRPHPNYSARHRADCFKP
jgi:putative restriction endonuclease